jgi:hypothetical protein
VTRYSNAAIYTRLPVQTEARRQHIHGPLVSLIEDDATWSRIHTGMVWLAAIVWVPLATIILSIVS